MMKAQREAPLLKLFENYQAAHARRERVIDTYNNNESWDRYDGELADASRMLEEAETALRAALTPAQTRSTPSGTPGGISGDAEAEYRRLVEDAFYGGYHFGWSENDGREEPPEEYMETAWRNSHARDLLDRLAALRAGVPAPPTAPGPQNDDWHFEEEYR